MDSFNDATSDLIKSPYLDMSLLPDANNYIYLKGDNDSLYRGRMELCFYEIGSAFLGGGAIGSVRGFLQGRKLGRGYPTKLYRVVLFNHIVKASTTLGNTMGVIAVLFSGSGILISKLRQKEDDLNNIGASTMTGVLYQTGSGKRKMMYGGVVGFCLGTLLTLWTQRLTIKNYFTPSARKPWLAQNYTMYDPNEE